MIGTEKLVDSGFGLLLALAAAAGLSFKDHWCHHNFNKVTQVCNIVSALSSYCRLAILTHFIGQEETCVSQALYR